jgi:hypothetical protein
MYEAYRMEYQYGQGNPMVLLMNPDSTVVMQNCSQYYCPTAWKPGIYQSGGHVIALPNLQADVFAAIDRMVTKGYISSGTGAAMKSDYITNTIATPPASSGRCPQSVCTPGFPEIVLSNTWAIKYLAPHIAFGYGNNEYDSTNAQLAPTGPVPAWATASFDWIHKINHIGLTQDAVQAGVMLEAQKFSNYTKDMNIVGRFDGTYKPDFLYFDRYERDVIPAYVSSGFLMNCVDQDTYLLYITDIDGLVGNLPWAYWQMPGSHMHVQTSQNIFVVGWNYVKGFFWADKPVAPQLTAEQMKHWMTLYLKAPRYVTFDHSKRHVKLHSTVGDTVPSNVTLDAPNLTGTVSLTMQDADPTLDPPPTPAHTYTHAVGVGTSLFDNLFYATGEWAHSYWCVGAHYTGTDSKVYWPVCQQPYSIGAQSPNFTVLYRYPVPVTTTAVTPKIASNTPSVTLVGVNYSYTHNLQPGTAQPFISAVVPDTYSGTGASYVNGTESFFYILQTPYIINQAGTNNVFMAYGTLSDTVVDWFFGNATLNNDFSNLDPDFSMQYIPFTSNMNTTIYFTKNAGVTNAVEYLKLTNAAP